jgi:hypothetical protein
LCIYRDGRVGFLRDQRPTALTSLALTSYMVIPLHTYTHVLGYHPFPSPPPPSHMWLRVSGRLISISGNIFSFTQKKELFNKIHNFSTKSTI